MWKLPVLLVSLLSAVQGELLCTNPRTSAMSLTITSKRNQTGHRLTQVSLNHGAQAASHEEDGTGAFEVDLEQNTVICEGVESVQIVAAVSAPPPRAGPGYELLPGFGYYKLHTTARTWENAWRTCAQEGAHLAVINSETEAKYLQLMFTRYPKITDANHNDYAFLGVHDMVTEGQYVTISGQPLNKTGYMKWMSGQPDNSGADPGSDCLSMYRSQANFNDLPCTWKLAAFCEQEVY